MASVVRLKSKDGAKDEVRVQFYGDGNKRMTIYLGRVPVKVAEMWGRRIEELVACRANGMAFDLDLAKWLRGLPDSSYAKLAGAQLVPLREKTEIHTVAQLTKAFVDRSPTKRSTLIGYKQTLDSLVEFFGPTRAITSITPGTADDWRVWIADDRKGGRKKRTTTDNRLSGPTVAKRVSVAKQVLRCAVRWGWIAKSPFDGLKPGSQANPARSFYVDHSTIMDVLDACPSVGWKVVVGLCRFAGLRCPSEVGSVTWGDVNWEKGRLTVRSQKTEHHGAEHAVRVVPISADLRLILDDAWSVAGEGATLVAPQAANPTSNLRTTMEKVIVRAGHQPWARLFQNLRASCETDWVEQYPAHVVAKWLGHSPKVAAQHYLMSRDHHFEDVVGGAGGPVRPESKRERTNVKSNAVPTRNPTPQVSAGVCGVSHEKTEPAATTRVAAGSSGIEPVVKTGKWRGQDSNL